jgi:hypothetical protein
MGHHGHGTVVIVIGDYPPGLVGYSYGYSYSYSGGSGSGTNRNSLVCAVLFVMECQLLT